MLNHAFNHFELLHVYICCDIVTDMKAIKIC